MIVNRGKAPAGHHTYLTVAVHLGNGKGSRTYAWHTPWSVQTAIRLAPKWAARALKEANVPGRSNIVGYDVQAHTEAGAYESLD